MLVYLLSIIGILLVLIIFPPKTYAQRSILFYFIGALLFLFIIIFYKKTPDYHAYLRMYEVDGEDFNVEFTYVWISYISKFLFKDFFGVVLIYGALGVFLKLKAIKEYSDFWFLSLLIYLVSFFLLQEYTQIRVGVATGILLLSVKQIYNKNLKKFLLLFLLAFAFHYSSIIMLPLYFLRIKPSRILLCFVVPIGYVTYYIGFDNILNLMPIPAIQEKIEGYKMLKDTGIDWMDNINVFNYVFLAKILLLYIFIWKFKLFVRHNKYFGIFLQIYAISLFCYLFFAFLPVFAGRIYEFFGVIEILLIPMIVYLNKKRMQFIPLAFVVAGVFFMISFKTFLS